MPTPVAVCYTSTQPITLPSPTLMDQVFHIADLNPPQLVQLYARGINTGDPGDVPMSYAWTVLDAPAGSTATFSDSSSASPVFGPIDQIWGNYRLKCVVTMTSGLVSEERALYAPNSAFVHVRVQSDALSLEKPARWERDWQDNMRNVIGAVEAVRADIYTQTIAQHGDVSLATGAKLDILVGGGTATFEGSPLHVHGRDALVLAGDRDLGIVALEAAPVDSYLPTAINQERLVFTASITGNITSGSALGIFRFMDALTLQQVDIALLHSGDTGDVSENLFQVYVGTVEGFESGTLDTVGEPFGGAPAATDGPKIYTWSGIDTEVGGAGAVLAVACTQSVDGTVPRFATLTVTALRKV